MSTDIQVFSPASSYTISATATTGNTALTQPSTVAGSAGNAGGYTRIKVFNTSTTVACYLQPGMASATATASSPFIAAPNVWSTFEIGYPATNIATIMASSGTVTILLMLGSGS